MGAQNSEDMRPFIIEELVQTEERYLEDMGIHFCILLVRNTLLGTVI